MPGTAFTQHWWQTDSQLPSNQVKVIKIQPLQLITYFFLCWLTRKTNKQKKKKNQTHLPQHLQDKRDICTSAGYYSLFWHVSCISSHLRQKFNLLFVHTSCSLRIRLQKDTEDSGKETFFSLCVYLGLSSSHLAVKLVHISQDFWPFPYISTPDPNEQTCNKIRDQLYKLFFPSALYFSPIKCKFPILKVNILVKRWK